MRFGRGGAVTALAWLVAMGCGTSSNDTPPPAGSTPNETPPPASATTDHDAGGDSAPTAPPPPAPPPPISGVPVDGVFVSASKGDDAGDATKLRPVKTLARAIQIAREKRTLPIVACAETYNEAVTLQDGVALYGYFDCSGPDWAKSTVHATIASPTSPAVLADTLESARVEGFAITTSDIVGSAPDASTPAASAFGMIVRSVGHFTLGDVTITAGKAQDGLDGVASSGVNGFVTPINANGRPGSGPVERKCGQIGCNFNVPILPNIGYGGDYPGGAGGGGICISGAIANPGGAGGAGLFSMGGSPVGGGPPEDFKGQPIEGTPQTAGIGHDPKVGARGAFGTNGAWSFTDAGFVPGSGTVGGTGGVGQGGRGGDGTTSFPAGVATSGTWHSGIGGGGGAGGCGGLAGTGGTGGGASVGLLVVNSQVSITTATISSSTGGRGGNGFAGGAGLPGGSGGFASGTNGAGTSGNNGAAGGQGGQSGHGSAGPSIALVYHGARPVTSSVNLKPGEAGAAGPALTDGAQSLPAAERIAKAEHSF